MKVNETITTNEVVQCLNGKYTAFLVMCWCGGVIYVCCALADMLFMLETHDKFDSNQEFLHQSIQQTQDDFFKKTDYMDGVLSDQMGQIEIDQSNNMLTLQVQQCISG